MQLKFHPLSRSDSNRVLGIGYTNDSKIEIPSLCPRCSVANNPIFERSYVVAFSDCRIIFTSQKCSNCSGYYWAINKLDSKHEPQSLNAQLLTVYPNSTSTTFQKVITDKFSDFVKAYHQAEQAEYDGSLKLAGTGYRMASEILVKDYLLESSDLTHKQVADLSLFRAIETVFHDDEKSRNASDVVRIYGNDYTHWDKPDDFDIISSLDDEKEYLNFLVARIQVQMRLIYPPVKRN